MQGIYASTSRITEDTFRLFWEDGIRAFSQTLWPGGYADRAAYDAVCEANLLDAQRVGMLTVGVICPSPWWSQDIGFWESQKRAGAAWPRLRALEIDIEQFTWPDGASVWATDAQNEEMLRFLEATGKKVATYTATWVWVALGRPDWGYLSHLPLMAAQYNGNPNLDAVYVFGPWRGTRPVGVQYTNSQVLNGATVCLESWDDNWMGDDMTDKELLWRVERIERILGLRDDTPDLNMIEYMNWLRQNGEAERDVLIARYGLPTPG